MMFDSTAGRTVLFGGRAASGAALDDTWERTTAAWQQVDGAAAPLLQGFAYAYHSAASVGVVFGGSNQLGQPSSDTWVFSGNNWSQSNQLVPPSPRSGAAMCYHAGRQRVVMYGGIDAQGNYLDDTWEFNGFAWTQVTVSSSPGGMANHAMAYDPARARVVACSMQPYQPAAGVYEYDGSGWQLVSPGPGFTARLGLVMATDPSGAGVLIFGGYDFWMTQIVYDELWRWDGTAMVQVLPPPGTPWPLGRQEAAMSLDPVRGRTILHGGRRMYFGYIFEDTWEWDGTRWHAAVGTSPSPRNGGSMAFDEAAGEIVLVGGEYEYNGASAPLPTRDAWAFANGLWRPVSAPASAPYLHAMAFDAARGQLVLFGGAETNETWLRNGGSWSRASPVTSPPARFSHAMAYDRARQEVVLFGGGQGYMISRIPSGTVFDDTWVWDGVNWTQRIVPTHPARRFSHGMAYDEARQRVVLFGGLGNPAGTGQWRDTWEWDGSVWTQRQPATVPPGTVVASLAHDRARGRTLLYPDWEWDGVDWRQRQIAGAPAVPGVMAYDPVSGQIVWFGGGLFAGTYGGETWLYGPTQPASYRTFGAGCSGSVGLPRLSAPGTGPWLGTGFELLLDGVAPSPGLLAFGFSNTTWRGAAPLPFDLGAFGFLGCWLYVDPVVLWSVLPGRVTVPVPNLVGLLGLHVYNQAAFLDTQAPGTLVFSNAGDGVLGGL